MSLKKWLFFQSNRVFLLTWKNNCHGVYGIKTPAVLYIGVWDFMKVAVFDVIYFIKIIKNIKCLLKRSYMSLKKWLFYESNRVFLLTS